MKFNQIEEIVSSNIQIIILGLVIFATLCGVIIALLYGFYFNGSITTDNDKWGLFGDYLGGTLNPILSFLALIAILLTVILQNKQLRLARDEALESGKTFQIQSFEKIFFEMLQLHVNIVEGISLEVETTETTYGTMDYNRTDKTYLFTGRHCFMYLRDELEKSYKEEIKDKKIEPHEFPIYIRQAYNAFANKYEHIIGHYFRFLYRIFKQLDEGKVDINKKHYAGITRALLSSNELALLFYDCFYAKGHKFARLVIKYSLLENMDYDKLFDKGNHIPLFDKSAYGEDDLTSIANTAVPTHFKMN